MENKLKRVILAWGSYIKSDRWGVICETWYIERLGGKGAYGPLLLAPAEGLGALWAPCHVGSLSLSCGGNLF